MKMSKSELLSAIATAVTSTKLTKAMVDEVLTALAKIVLDEIKSNDEITIPGVIKIKAVHKPATPKRKGINPFTKKEVTYEAKGPTTKLKAVLPKCLKDAIK